MLRLLLTLSIAAWTLAAQTAGGVCPEWPIEAAQASARREDFLAAGESLDLISRAAASCSVEVLTKAANMYTQIRQREKGVSLLEQGLDRHPRSVAALKQLGQALFQIQPRNPRAGAAFRRVVTLAKTDAEAHFLYGRWAWFNRLDACIQELETAVRLDPNNDEAAMQAYTMIAMTHARQRRQKEADTAFQLALRHNSRMPALDPETAMEYVRFLDSNSRDDQAERLVDRILARAPEFGPAWLEKAKALARNDRNKEAAAGAELALRYAGEDREQLRAVHIFLARIYHALADEEKARAHEQWLRSHPR